VPAMSSFFRAACCARESSVDAAAGGEEEGTGVAWPPRDRRVATMVVLLVLSVVLKDLGGREERGEREGKWY